MKHISISQTSKTHQSPTDLPILKIDLPEKPKPPHLLSSPLGRRLSLAANLQCACKCTYCQRNSKCCCFIKNRLHYYKNKLVCMIIQSEKSADPKLFQQTYQEKYNQNLKKYYGVQEIYLKNKCKCFDPKPERNIVRPMVLAPTPDLVANLPNTPNGLGALPST